MTITQSNINVRTKQIIVREMSATPHVGYEHPKDKPDGWLFDIKRWSSPFDLKLPSLPRLSNCSSQGVDNAEYFRSGVGAANLNDLYVSDFAEVASSGEKHWYPFVSNGFYYRYNIDYFYYSDNSIVQYVNATDNRTGRNYIELNKTPAVSFPILASSFKRNSLKEITYGTRVKQRYTFAGIYSAGVEQETVSELGKITWANVDFTKKEFIVDNTIDGLTRLFFNRDYSDTVGVIPAVYNDLGACEYLGLSTGAEYQVFYLQNFPVLANSSFHLYVATDTTWVEWIRMDSWWDLIIGSWAYPYPDGNRYFVDKDLGIVYFGSNDAGGIPATGNHIVATYSTTLRVEYEELDRNTSIVAIDADVNPVVQSTNQGFVCISHSEIEAYDITLTINKQRIAGTSSPVEYGPITVGSDYGILKATVISPGDIPVPGAEIGYTITPTDLGSLNGDSTSISFTDSSGNAYTNYQPPISADELGFYSVTVRNSTHVSYPDDREVILKVDETGLAGKESEIYLFQILKDDPIMGFETLDDFLLDLYQEDTPPWVVDAADYIRWKQEMILEHELEEWDGSTITEGEPINGRKVVVYQQAGYGTTNLLLDGNMESYPEEVCVDGNMEFIPVTSVIVDGDMEAAAPIEVLIDGDMEAVGVASWTAYQSVLTKDTTIPLHDGGGAQHLRVTASAGAGDRVPNAGQTILTPGKTYRIRGVARSDGTQLPKVYESSGTPLWTGTNSTSWQYFDVFYTSITATAVRLAFTITGPVGTEYVEFDDVEVLENAIWYGSEHAVLTKDTTAPLQEGTQHLRVTARPAAGVVVCSASQVVLSINTTYRITGYARSDTTEAPRISDGTQRWIGGTTGNWEAFDVTFVATGTTLLFYFIATGPAGTEYVEFDDVEVVAQNGSWVSSFAYLVTREVSDLPNSTQCLRLAYVAFNYPYVTQNIFTVGKSYRISGYARSAGVGGEYPRVLTNGGASALWTGTSSTSWQSFNFTFVATHIDFIIQGRANAGGEYCDFDNIQVLEQDGVWTTDSNVKITKELTNPQQGLQSVRVAYNTGANPTIKQSTFSIGLEYRITGWARSDGNATPRFYMGTGVTWTGTTSTSWQSFDETVTTDSIDFTLEAVASVYGHYVEFDNIVITLLAESGPLLDATAINPVTGSLGAYVPVRPLLVEKITDVADLYYGYWRLIYPEGSVPDCGIGDLYTVGGYWIISSKLVTFQAHCWSPYYNQYIYSNSILARISLPNYLLGEYINSSSQKVPFGWKLTSDDNVASGLDGATFITINPHSGPYEIIDLVNGTGATDTWASAPFRTLNFTFNIL